MDTASEATVGFQLSPSEARNRRKLLMIKTGGGGRNRTNIPRKQEKNATFCRVFKPLLLMPTNALPMLIGVRFGVRNWAPSGVRVASALFPDGVFFGVVKLEQLKGCFASKVDEAVDEKEVQVLILH